MPDITDSAARTIAVKATGRWRLRRLRVEYPAQAVSAIQRPPYDATLARELLSRTCEIPSTRRGLLAVLTEYRHALSALAAEPANTADAGWRVN
jgi:hypothetical protein